MEPSDVVKKRIVAESNYFCVVTVCRSRVLRVLGPGSYVLGKVRSASRAKPSAVQGGIAQPFSACGGYQRAIARLFAISCLIY